MSIFFWLKISYFIMWLQGPSHWGQRSHGPHQLQFPNQTRSKNFISNIRDIAFYRCSEIIRTRNFTVPFFNFTIFGQFMAAFHFFKLNRENRSLHVRSSEKVRYLTLDLLKSFFLWTIRKKTTKNESLNLRNPGPTEKVL